MLSFIKTVLILTPNESFIQDSYKLILSIIDLECNVYKYATYA
jgi:hypothetical protein